MKQWLSRWWPIIVVVVLAGGYLALLGHDLLVDEIPHFEQASAFASGEWVLNPDLTVIPGYHVLLASFSLLFGLVSAAAFRFFSLLFGLAAVGVFFLVAREVGVLDSPSRTMQFLFLPVLFPFLFLIYTDSLSLLLVLLMALFSLRGRLDLAGLFGLLSCLVRQNNVVWVAFFFLFCYVGEHGWRLPSRARSLLRYWTFGLTGLLFVLFVFLNGEVSLGDSSAHPSFSFHATNVWFLLFLSFFFFLPLLWEHRGAVFSLLRRPRSLLVGGGLAAVFLLTFVNDHPYNVQWGEYFLRNRLLIFFTSSVGSKLLFLVPVLLAVALFAVVPLRRRWWLLYPFTVVFLVPSWLVEQRYYIIPLSLFLLARVDERSVVERWSWWWFALLSLCLFLAVLSGRYFL